MEGIIRFSKELPKRTDKLGSLRYELTKHTERYLLTNENFSANKKLIQIFL